MNTDEHEWDYGSGSRPWSGRRIEENSRSRVRNVDVVLGAWDVGKRIQS